MKGEDEMNQKKVLVVEDDKFLQEWLSKKLGGKVLLLQAFTIEKAWEIFTANPDVSVIAMDACVPGDQSNTQPLVRKIRQTFRGPIIATSSVLMYRKELLRAGCDQETTKDKIPQKILELIGVL